MPTRLHLADGDHAWTAEVVGNDVRLPDTGESRRVERGVDGRLTVTGTVPGVTGAAARRGNVIWVTIDGVVFAFTVGAGGGRTTDRDALAPPMPATVVRVAVAAGQHVRQGDLLVALEAMKMELPIRAPRDGVVRAVHCREGELVQPGERLVDL